TIKRRMVDQIKEKVEAVMRFQRQIAYIERQLTQKNRRPKLKEDERKNLQKQQKELKVQVKTMADKAGETPEQMMRHLEPSARGGSRRRRSWSKRTFASSCRSRRSTRTADCSSWI